MYEAHDGRHVHTTVDTVADRIGNMVVDPSTVIIFYDIEVTSTLITYRRLLRALGQIDLYRTRQIYCNHLPRLQAPSHDGSANGGKGRLQTQLGRPLS